MPFISVDGKLVEVSQAQYDAYTAPVIGGSTTVPAGGNVTSTATATSTILTPNTTNNTPGQTLATTYPTVATTATTINDPTAGGAFVEQADGSFVAATDAPVNPATDPTAGGAFVEQADGSFVAAEDLPPTDINGKAYSPTEDPNTPQEVSAVTTETGAAPTSPANDSIVNAQDAARAGLTADQLAVLGSADATDPFIRARLDLPPLSEVQTLAGAIGNINFGNIGNVVTTAIADIQVAAGNVGNAISDFFSSGTPNTVPASSVTTAPDTTNAGASIQTFDDGTTLQTFDDGSVLATGTDGSVTSAPAPVDSTVDPEASLAPGETIVPANQIDAAPADTNFGTTTQTFDDGTTIQTFDDGSVLATGTDGGISATDAPVDPATDPTAGGAFVETSPGVFQAAEDLPVDPATDPTAGGAFVEQADGSFVAAEDLPPTDINGEAYSPTEDPNTPQEVSAVTTDINTGAETTTDPYAAQDAENGANAGTGTGNTGTGTSADSAAASANIQGLVKGAQQQKTIADQRKQINNGDWRVRLRLAPQAKYLYNAANPGILKPLQVTDGIIFPYTPAINTTYRAQYTPYDLTHSNYRGYWYQNSYVNEIQLTATFTAQDTNDANYLLAVIHFLRSATKMFYGQDAERGTPPPLVYLSGFGDYQFREHACAISNFNYNLPADVDYIRAGSPNNAGLNFNNIRDRQSVATNSIFNSVNRLAAAFLTKGAITGSAAPPTLGLNRPTYVPTKMEIQLTLLPVQSRQQVSKQFSLKEFANGNLLKGGFW
jgi:hypothetical protein